MKPNLLPDLRTIRQERIAEVARARRRHRGVGAAILKAQIITTMLMRAELKARPKASTPRNLPDMFEGASHARHQMA